MPTFEATLRNNINPTTDSSQHIRNTIILTDSNGTPTSILADVAYVYFVLPPFTLPLLTNLMNSIQSKIVLHSDLNGFAIFNRAAVPELEVGFNSGYCRVPVTVTSNFPSKLVDGEYVMDLS